MDDIRNALLRIPGSTARTACQVIEWAPPVSLPKAMIRANRVAVQREFLNYVSELLWRVADDRTQPDEVRDEAHDLAFTIGDLVCYRQDLVVDGVGPLPIGFAEPQYYTDMVNQLVFDLYGSEEPDDLRCITIFLARKSAAICDDMLYTREMGMAHYEVLRELVASIQRHADDEYEDETTDQETDQETDDEPQIVRSTNGIDY